MKLFKENSYKILPIIILFLFTSSCTLTKMRYSRGYKPEFSFFSGREHPQDIEQKAKKAIKKDGNQSADKLTICDRVNDSVEHPEALQTESVVNPLKHISPFITHKTAIEPGRQSLLNKISPQNKRHSISETAEMYDTEGLTIIAVGLMLVGITLFVLGAAQIIAGLWITVGAIAFFSGVVLGLILTIINLVNGGWQRQVQYEKNAIKNRIIWGLALGLLLLIIGLFS